jgi:hypothetical protein
MIYNKKQTIELIEDLAKDLKPIKRKGWKLPCIIWCGVILGLILFNYYYVADMVRPIKNPFFDMITNTVFLLGIITSFSSFFYAVFASLPGRNYQIWKHISFFSFILWGIMIISEMIIQKTFSVNIKEFYHCTTGTIITGILLFIILYYFIKKRFILDLESAILGGILASSVSGTICFGFVCQIHDPAHIFYTHYLPIMLLFLISYMIFFIKYKYFQTLP